jgi:hypothetical protein
MRSLVKEGEELLHPNDTSHTGRVDDGMSEAESVV